MITGPMFSGKSEELIKRIRHYSRNGAHFQVFNHILDDRYTINKIVSHSQLQWNSISVSESLKILSSLLNETMAVFIDEIQFFDHGIVSVIDVMIAKGLIVVAAGLDKNYRGEFFINTAHLMETANKEVMKLRSICTICKKRNATLTTRIPVSESPSSHDKDEIRVGGAESYEPRCKKHHSIM